MKPLKHMTIEKSEQGLSMDEALVGAAPKYPYGLRITLEDAVLKKLGLSKLPEVGQTMGLHAMVKVVSVSDDNGPAGSSELSVSLQITDMALEEKSEDQKRDEEMIEKQEKQDYSSTILGS